VPSGAGVGSNASDNIALLPVGGLLFGRKLSRKLSASALSADGSHRAQESGSRGTSCRARRSFRSDQGTSDLIITMADLPEKWQFRRVEAPDVFSILHRQVRFLAIFDDRRSLRRAGLPPAERQLSGSGAGTDALAPCGGDP